MQHFLVRVAQHHIKRCARHRGVREVGDRVGAAQGCRLAHEVLLLEQQKRVPDGRDHILKPLEVLSYTCRRRPGREVADEEARGSLRAWRAVNQIVERREQCHR